MTDQQSKVNNLIERVERHQAALRLSDHAFAARYRRHLGSYDSWRRLRAKAWDHFGEKLSKWEKRLNVFVAELDGGSEVSDVFDALPIMQAGRGMYQLLQGQRSDRRVSWLIGPTGVGKSWTMQSIVRDDPQQAVYIHVNRGGRESMMILASMLARSVGGSIGSGGAATYENVVEALKANPITLCIDDAHEGGVLLLKLIKHLVDDTRSKFVLGTYPTAWRMLLNGSTDAQSEAQQLLGRSIKPIDNRWSEGVQAVDVAAYLSATLGGKDWRVTAGRIAPTLRRYGNFRALADAVELAIGSADHDEVELSPEMIEEAVVTVCPKEASR